MPEISTWLKDYVALATAVAAMLIAISQYFLSRRKAKLEMALLRKQIDTNSDNISKIQSVLLEQLPVYPDEMIVYSNPFGSLRYDFEGYGGNIWDGDTPITEKGSGVVRFLEKGIINIDRDNTCGRYELHLRKYTVGDTTNEFIPKDETGSETKQFRVACEARSLSGEHTLRFVLRDLKRKKWIGQSVTHRITLPNWEQIEAIFNVPPPFVEAELRIDDEQVSTAPSTIQIRKLMMTQRMLEQQALQS